MKKILKLVSCLFNIYSPESLDSLNTPNDGFAGFVLNECAIIYMTYK